YLPDFSDRILTEQEVSYQAWLLTRQLAPEDLAEEIRRNKKDYVETATGFIDLVKTTLTPVDVVFEELGYSDRHRYLIDLFHGFEQWRKARSQITYADMLYEPVLAIHQNPALQRLVGNKMDLVLVDEYQDTNEIQHLLLRYVAGERARVTVVGDPDQTIYEFRGARPEFILRRFREEFDEPLQQTLSYSFRYGHRVALLANHLITHNQGRHDVLCHAHPSTPASQVHFHESAQDSPVVVQLLEALPSDQQQQTAILFRVWSQSVPIELRLLARQIPYRIDAGKGALFSREVEAITSLLQVLTGQLPHMATHDRLEAARHLLRFPHVGLKEQELGHLAQMLAGFDSGWDRCLLNLDTSAMGPMPARKLRRLGEALAALDGFSGSVAGLLGQYAEHTDLFEGIRGLALTHETANERIDTVQGFRAYLASLDVSAPEALAHLQNLRRQALEKRDRSDAPDRGVLLSTIHRTKGLEWPRVILPGLQEKYLPYSPRQQDDLQAFMESERRLLYVALTRTRNELHLITRPGGPRPAVDADQAPSRFVAELCFGLSERFGHWLDQRDRAGAGGAELFRADTPLTAVARRYASRAGVELTGEAPAEAPGHPAIWHCRRLTHAIFGPGTVLAETDTAFDVQFDEGRKLTFSKKSAHLYFRPMTDA
ncbi:MAG: ATP-dependent helicase, partial [Marinobacter sp.]